MKTRQAYYILDPETDTKQDGDEYFDHTGNWVRADPSVKLAEGFAYRRPIPDAPTPDDGWIPWGGGDRPVDQSVEVEYRMRDGEVLSRRAGLLYWKHHQPLNHDIIAYRIAKAPEPQWRPLGPDDVPPGSIIRKIGEGQTWHWRLISYVDALKMVCADRGYPYEEVMNTHEILRPGEDWQPCKKLAK